MKILLFATAPSLKRPKIASFVLARITELKRLGHEVVVLQGGNISIGRPALTGITLRDFYRFAAGVIKMFFRNSKKIFKNDAVEYVYYDRLYFSSYGKFQKWFSENGFDFVHAHFVWTAYKLPEIKKECGIKYVLTCHGSDIHTAPFESARTKEITLNVMRNADGIFFVSEYLHKKSDEFGFDGKKYLITYNGYNPAYFYPSKTKELQKSKNDEVTLCFIGNPIAIKRFDKLPEIFRIVKQSLPNAKLLCVGSTVKKADLRVKAKTEFERLGLWHDVTYIEKVPYAQVAQYMRSADIILMPSVREGFSCTALEAQACGTPVVSSANGGLPEATGNIGLCVPEGENFIYDFAQKIIDYIQSPFDQEFIVHQSEGKTWADVVQKEIAGYEQWIYSEPYVVS